MSTAQPATQACLSVVARDPHRVCHLPVLPGGEADLAAQLERGDSWLVGAFGTGDDAREWFVPTEGVQLQLVPSCRHAGQSTLHRDLPGWLGLESREERVFEQLIERAPVEFGTAMPGSGFAHGVVRPDAAFLLVVDEYARDDPAEVADLFVARALGAAPSEVQQAPRAQGWPVLRVEGSVTPEDVAHLEKALEGFFDVEPHVVPPLRG